MTLGKVWNKSSYGRLVGEDAGRWGKRPMLCNKVVHFYLEDDGEQMKDLKTGVAQSDMQFRMLTLTKEEKAVKGVKSYSFNKYLFSGIFCVPHTHLAGRVSASQNAQPGLETGERLGGQCRAAGVKKTLT